MKKALSLSETARILGISKATVSNWTKQGLIKAQKDGLKICYFSDDVHKLKILIENGDVEKLKNRANKKNSVRTFIPDEYFLSGEDLTVYLQIKDYIDSHHLQTGESLFVLTLNLLIRYGILPDLKLAELLKPYKRTSKHQNINEELTRWQTKLDFKSHVYLYGKLLNYNLPAEEEILGLLYQSLKKEGEKSRDGSYYTPPLIAEKLIEDLIVDTSGPLNILDPCCGSGQFLIVCGKKLLKTGRLLHPENLWGFDIDPLAVQLARINLMLHFRDYNFSPNIHFRNMLYDYSYRGQNEGSRKFDLIVGNPPWGAEFIIEQSTFLKDQYPKILSQESFSYFILIGLNLLKPNGKLSFILPESILNVSTHRDIRNYILHNSYLSKITAYGRIFSKVFTPVIRLDLFKNAPSGSIKTNIQTESESYMVDTLRFYQNAEKIFDIYLKNEEESIIRKIQERKHHTLKGNAEWALGIVTGNNKLHLSQIKRKGYEEIIKGSDIMKFYFRKPALYIRFDPVRMQQVAPVSKYRAEEKILYRFISKKLIFALDTQKKLSLNSANILIPKLQTINAKAITALFNSKLYQFYFQRKFFTHKVLRQHLEQMPLPYLTETEHKSLVSYCESLMICHIDKQLFQSRMDEMNNYIYSLFNLNPDEIKNIEQVTNNE